MRTWYMALFLGSFLNSGGCSHGTIHISKPPALEKLSYGVRYHRVYHECRYPEMGEPTTTIACANNVPNVELDKTMRGAFSGHYIMWGLKDVLEERVQNVNKTCEPLTSSQAATEVSRLGQYGCRITEGYPGF